MSGLTKRKIRDVLHKKPAEKKALSPEMRHLIAEAQHVKRLQSDGNESHRQEPSLG